MRRRLAFAGLLLLAISLGGLAWLGYTESGLQWAYRQALTHIPGDLQVSEVSGRLTGPVKLSDIRHRNNGQAVELRKATLDWNLWALLDGELEIRLIHLNGLQIQLRQTETPATESATALMFPEIALPVAIDLQRLEVDDMRITRDDETVLLEQLQISLSGKLKPSPELPHEIEFSWRARLNSGENLQGGGKLAGNLSHTRLTQSVAGSLQLDLDLGIDNPLTQPRWQAELDLTRFDTTRVNPTLPVIAGSLQLSASGDLTSANASGRLGLEQSPYGALATDFKLQRVVLTEKADGINFNQLRLNLLRGEIETSGSFIWQPEPRWQANVSARAIDPGLIRVEYPGRIDAEFDLVGAIPADGLTLALDIEQLGGELRGYPVALRGKLDWRNNAADIDGLEITSGNTRVEIEGKLAQQLDLEWSLASENLAELYPDASGKLNAKGRVTGTQDKPLIKAHLNGADIGLADFEAQHIDANLDFALNLQQANQLPAQRLNLELQGRQIRWREFTLNQIELTTDERGLQAIVVAPQGKADLELVGTLQAEGWRGKLVNASLQNQDYGAWQLVSPATLAIMPEHYSIDSLCLQNPHNGKLCVTLRHRQAAGELDLDLRDLPLQLLRRWMPPELDIESRADVTAQLQYALPQRLLGQVDIELHPGSIGYRLAPDQGQRIEFNSGKIHAALNESGIDAMLDLRLPEGDGVDGVVSLPGANLLTLDPKTQSMRVSLNLRLQELGLIDAALSQVENLHGSLEAELDIEGSMLKPRLSGKARLKHSKLFLPQTKLEITGLNIDAHSDSFDQIEYRAQARIAEGSFALDGKTWLDAGAGWPSEVKINGEQISVGALLQPYLPENLLIDGLISADAVVSLQTPAQLEVKVALHSPQGLLTYPLPDDESGQWTYRDVRLDLQIDERGVTVEGNLDIDESHLRASFRLPDARPLDLDLKTQALDGRLDLSSQDFSLLEFLLPDLRQPRGQLQLSLDVAGTLAQPQLLGRAKLELTSLNIPRLGLSLKQINLQADTDQTGLLSLNGSANSGNGFIKLQGSGQLDADRGWPTSLRITGENFEVARVPEAIISLSPDLKISLAHKTVDIQGEILIPYARLRPRDLTSAARVSNDTVIVGDEQTAEYGWDINSKVRLLLGERVSLFGYGFDGLLGGNLVIVETPGQPTRGTGEITIVKGRYRAYGQHLDVDQGRLLFTGGPLNNPGLDIRAVRKTRDVTAGVKVTGRLQQPRVDLFSIPSLGQTDTLSYLLTGGPLDSASSGQGAMMANAAMALGLTGGDQIARSIGDRFGFDEMRVESSSSGDQASLVVGRYLSPRLYVGYGVGLIESINTFNLRYQISDRWQVEAESGLDQGADLFYQFER